MPGWSPDGTRIAFQSFRDGNSEIYAMNADGSDQTRLTTNPGPDLLPAWSPDGARIAYVSRVGEGSEEIYVMDADGSNKVRLTFNLAGDEFPTWSPDGAKIAYTSTRGGRKEIYVMNADGSSQVPLVQLPPSGVFHRHEAPAWSPDGARIAFHSRDDIYVINIDGTDEIRLTNNPDPIVDGFPAWSPDGTKIAFGSGTDGNVDIYAMNADGSGRTRLTNHPDIEIAPHWAPGNVVVSLAAGDGGAASTIARASQQAIGSLELVGTALTEKVESPLAGVHVHGNYAYVGSQSIAYGDPSIKTGIRILDISDPANPALVGRIPLRSLEFGSNNDGGEGAHSHGDAVATRIDSPAFQGDIAIVLQGVPDTFSVDDYPMPFGIWDVTNPADPEFLGHLSLGHDTDSGNLGDKPDDNKAVHGQYFYAIYSMGDPERQKHETRQRPSDGRSRLVRPPQPGGGGPLEGYRASTPMGSVRQPRWDQGLHTRPVRKGATHLRTGRAGPGGTGGAGAFRVAVPLRRRVLAGPPGTQR